MSYLDAESTNLPEVVHVTKINQGFSAGIIEELPTSMIRPSSTPLRGFCDADIVLLAYSINEKGLLHPLVVRPKDGHFEVVAGNRRYHACKYLRWKKITCHVIELDDKDAFEVALAENIQRKSMDPVTEAKAYRKYVEVYGWGGLSELARRIGKSTAYLSKRISILDLPADVLDRLKAREISPSLAEELLPLNDKNLQSELAKLIATRHLSMRKSRQIIKEENDKDAAFQSDLHASERHAKLEEAERSITKTITVMRIALNRLGRIIEERDEEPFNNDTWICQEMLMQTRDVLHKQIDNLMKERKDIRRFFT